MRFYHLSHTLGMGLLLSPLFSLANEAPALISRQQEKTALLAAIIEDDIPDILQVSNERIEIADINNAEKPTQQTKPGKIISIDMRAKIEWFTLRNKKLRRDDKRENEQQLEPMLRINAWLMQDHPVYGRVELEWKRKTKRKSGSQAEKQTKLELNQAYIGLSEDIIPHAQFRLGRWLYRDEREWLFDENLDGIYAESQFGNWLVEAQGSRVNHWQKDLMDRSTRNTHPVNIGSVMLRRKLEGKWHIGAYAVAQHHADNRDRQLNVGLRSHNPARKGLQHWFELGMSEEKEFDVGKRGYAVDLGGTYLFDYGKIKPRVSLGYAFGSRDYQQTGLNSNEATLGGGTKFKIYGETLNPDLTNIHILTAGLGINLSRQATLDVVYHAYNQARLSEFSNNKTALNSRYDRQNTRYLGSGLDMVFGWKPTDNTKIEAIAGMFTPSKRFASDRKPNSPRSDEAYSVGLEVEIKF